MSVSGRDVSLWMGDISAYMDETFIQAAFSAMGEQISAVRIIKNKTTATNVGYCFVNFKDEQTALRAMHRLNGKLVPNSQPPSRFMLNHSSASSSGQQLEFSLFVGDLDLHVDDQTLYQAFSEKFNSVRSARVIYDKSTKLSRGYAFVRFGDEQQRQQALNSMNGYTGLGSKPMRVSVAVPKKAQPAMANPAAMNVPGQMTEYGGYYDPQWYNYGATWPGYGCYDPMGYMGYGYNMNAVYSAGGCAVGPNVSQSDGNTTETVEELDDNHIVEHETVFDVERSNRDYVLRSEELWDALDASRWLQPDSLNTQLSFNIKPVSG